MHDTLPVTQSTMTLHHHRWWSNALWPSQLSLKCIASCRRPSPLLLNAPAPWPPTIKCTMTQSTTTQMHHILPVTQSTVTQCLMHYDPACPLHISCDLVHYTLTVTITYTLTVTLSTTHWLWPCTLQSWHIVTQYTTHCDPAHYTVTLYTTLNCYLVHYTLTVTLYTTH